MSSANDPDPTATPVASPAIAPTATPAAPSTGGSDQSLAGTAVNTAMDFVPFVKSYKLAQQGDYLKSALWGGVDLAGLALLVVPVGGEVAEGTIAAAKATEVAAEVAPLAVKSAPLGGALCGKIAGMTAPFAEKCAALFGNAGVSLAEKVAPVAEKGAVFAESTNTTIAEKAAPYLNAVSTASAFVDKINPVSQLTKRISPVVKEATQPFVDRIAEMGPVAKTSEKVMPHLETIAPVASATKKVGAILKKASNANDYAKKASDFSSLFSGSGRGQYRTAGMTPEILPVDQTEMMTPNVLPVDEIESAQQVPSMSRKRKSPYLDASPA